MRRMLIGVTVAAAALAAAVLLSQPEPPTDPNTGKLEVRDAQGLLFSIEPRRPSEEELRQWAATLQRMQDEGQFSAPPIDTDISIMEFRIVAQERIDGDAYLLTEVCAWKGGRVEQRRFLALQRNDGPLRGWMYQLAESDT
jgi:hypothetical protein